MSFVNWKVEYFGDKASSTVQEEITRFYGIQVIKETGDSKNSFEFKLSANNDLVDTIEPQDKIRISRVVNGNTFTTDDVVMVGIVNEKPREVTTSNDMYKIKGNDLSRTLTDATVFVDARDLQIDKALQKALNHIKTYAEEYAVDWDSNNPTTTINGNNFPTVDERWYDKPFRQILEEYSDESKTGDTDYYYYVDVDDKLIWRPEEDNVQDTLDIADGIRQFDTSRDTEEVINFVKVQGGFDPRGVAVSVKEVDYGSAGKHGLRYKFVSDIAKDAETIHSEQMAALGAEDSSEALPGEISPDPYPFIVNWDDNTQVSGDDEYVEELRSYVSGLLNQKADNILRNNENGYLEQELTIHPRFNTYTLGELYSSNVGQLTGNNMRVKEIQYTSVADVITMREDEPSV